MSTTPHQRRRARRRLTVAATAGALALAGLAVHPSAASAASTVTCTEGGRSAGVLTVPAGATCTVTATTTLDTLVIEDGGTLTAPDGDLLTLTVDGVEQGQVFDTWYGVTSSVQAGTYTGSVVLTPAVSHTKAISKLAFPIRQALYVDADGVESNYSVPAAQQGYTTLSDTEASNLKIVSRGQGFNGVWVDGGTYSLTNPDIELTGAGRSDFVGNAAGIVADSSTVTVDGAKIDNDGAVRTAIVNQGENSNMIVKNSSISVKGGDTLAGYQPNTTTDYMQDAPWMLGINGTARATNLLGDDNKSSFINSSIYAEGLGVLSTDYGSNNQLTAINSTVSTGDSGYGTYAIGNADEDLLGTTFNVADYGTILTSNDNGLVHFGASDAATVAAMNTSRAMGLTAKELAAIPARATTVNSDRVGVMLWGNGAVKVDGGTTFNTGGPVFLDKGTSTDASVSVDGSEGGSLNSDEGVIVQLMDTDNAGTDPQTVEGVSMKLTDKTYTDTGVVTPNTSWDLSDPDVSSRLVVDLGDTAVKGNFFNGARTAKNLVLNLDNTTVNGLISSSSTAHRNGVTTISSENWNDVSAVDNTVSAPVNNGIVLDLQGSSKWIVPGTSYLTSLTVGDDASIVGRGGKDVTVTIGGVDYSPAALTAGKTYTGTADEPIVVKVADGAIASTTSVSAADTTSGTAGTAKISVHDYDGLAAPGQVTVSVDGTAAGTATLDDDGNASVALPVGLGVGSHAVTAAYAGDSATGIAASSGTASFTVKAAASTPPAQAASKAKLKLSKHTVRKGKRLKARFKVKSAGAVPTGALSLYRGKKLLHSYTLTAAKNGTLVVRLPKFKKPGVYKLRLVYAGSATTASSHSTVVKLHVTR